MIAVVYALVAGFATRTLTVGGLPAVILEAAKTTAIVMLLIGVSGISRG